MDSAFPAADVKGYLTFVADLILPDPGDKHVLAAAIAADADVIVTNNLKHFPRDVLAPLSIQAVSPDEFVSQLIATDKKTALLALENQIKLLRNPPLSKEDVLRNLENCGLSKGVAKLKE